MNPSKIRIVGIIGDPIAHSLSPAMHNAVLKKDNFRYFYMPFHVTKNHLKDFVANVLRLHLAGFNVTIPHKEKILPHLSWLSPEARAIGAVNTVVVSGRRLKGYNTDAAGYLRSLKEETGFNPSGKKILILGAGGATRAVLYALAQAGAEEIALANRTRSRAESLAKEFGRKFSKSTKIVVIPFLTSLIHKVLPEIDLLVNTTSVGLNGTRFAGLSLKSLNKKAIVSDLVYRPPLTPLLRDAKRRGLKTHPGLGMLLHQGALAAKLWTKKNADLRVMKKALLDALK